MNKKLYANLRFTQTDVPDLPCPSCQRGRLMLSKGFVRNNDSAWTLRSKSDDDWEPEYTCSHFSALLGCNNLDCKETVHLVGEGRVEEVIDGYDDRYGPIGGLCTVYKPKYFVPALRIFDCPIKTPEPVMREINASFALFFADPSSSANRVRSAVESLLTALKVPIKERTKKGEFKRSNLHRRIERLGSKYDDIKVMLIAVKWIGNTGSHTSDLKRKDVLVAYEMLEHCLNKLYNESSDLLSQAKAINRKKGPLRTIPHRRIRRTGSVKS